MLQNINRSVLRQIFFKNGYLYFSRQNLILLVLSPLQLKMVVVIHEVILIYIIF